MAQVINQLVEEMNKHDLEAVVQLGTCQAY